MMITLFTLFVIIVVSILGIEEDLDSYEEFDQKKTEKMKSYVDSLEVVLSSNLAKS